MKQPSWRQAGTEPDYRFSLANERTFLAWIRTALALLAGGVLLDQFSTKLQPRIAVGLAVGLCLLAALMSVQAYRRWRGNEIAMRCSAPLPHGLAIPLLAVGSVGAAGLVAFVLMAR